MIKAIPPVDIVYPTTENKQTEQPDLPGSELGDQGRDVRGIYVPTSRFRLKEPRPIVDWIVKRVGATAVIIDVKDDFGRITFTTDVPEARPISNVVTRRIPKVVEQLKEIGIYVIGRLVCFKDNLYPRAHPEDAIRDRRTGKLWRDRSEMSWIDPYSPAAREYIATVAKAAQAIGFDEIQLDYVRFPVEPEARYGLFPNREGKGERYEAIAALLAHVDREITIPLSIDVFGLTAYTSGDPDGLGQSLEHLAPHIDAISPMLYLANFPSRFWENPKPESTYALVHNAVRNIRRRLGDHIAVRPLLQGFRYRALNYGAAFLRNQIEAAKNAGSSGYLFWNQTGGYSVLAAVWRPYRAPHILTPRPDAN